MGLMFPRISAYVLAASGDREQGGNSAAMSIADAVGGATAISLAGLLFTAVGTAADLAPLRRGAGVHHRAGRGSGAGGAPYGHGAGVPSRSLRHAREIYGRR